jgi:cytidylate kinase
VVAPREVRIQTAIDRLGVAPGDAESILDDTDRNRDRYHREYYDRDWNDPENYHMVFNTELVGVDRVAELVIAYARSLGW